MRAWPGASGNVDFEEVEERKLPLLYEAAGNFLDRGPHEAAAGRAVEAVSGVLPRARPAGSTDYALYAELRRQFKTGAWTAWPEPLRRRQPRGTGQGCRGAWARPGQGAGAAVCLFAAVEQLREAAAQQGNPHPGRRGDLRQHGFGRRLGSSRTLRAGRGVEADSHRRRAARLLFADRPALGQSALSLGCARRSSGFGWWIERIRRACELYDIVRLDHFRGFEAYWAIPADEETAVNGEWVKAPGLELFRALEAALGPLPLVAEDLGLITPEVDALRLELGLPGMKVLQFGFSNKGAHTHLPHHFAPATVAYTGTHDNDTTLGWWEAADKTERAAVEAYVGAGAGKGSAVWPLIRAVESSVAQMAVVPAQDLLELGSEARMNTPAVACRQLELARAGGIAGRRSWPRGSPRSPK